MKTISKAFYLEILLSELGSRNSNEGTAPEDLEALVDAYEYAKAKDFDEVEVLESNGVYKFQIVEKK